MNKKLLNVLCALFAFCLLFALASCDRGTFFYDCVGVWSCEELTIESFGGNPRPRGTLKLDGVEYELHIGYHTTSARFYDKAKTDKRESGEGYREEMLIWVVRTELDGEKLYVTVVKDYISDKEGRTYVLQKQQ